MSYIKAEEILPEGLIRQIQEYADGVYIYIPRKPGTRHAWGQETDYKAELKLRNDRIRSDYTAGASVTALSRKYHLSEKSIRRILQNQYTLSREQSRLKLFYSPRISIFSTGIRLMIATSGRRMITKRTGNSKYMDQTGR